LKILVQDLNKYVAISEEFANNVSGKVKSGGLLFDRKVARVVTPGTLIDEKFMDPFENNFLLAIHLDTAGVKTQTPQLGDESSVGHQSHLVGSQHVGLAWLDLSTGDFFTQIATVSSLPSAIARIGAREIIVDETLRDLTGQEIQLLVGHDRHLVTFHRAAKSVSPISQWNPMLETPIHPEIESHFTPEEVAAGFHLLQYASSQLQGVKMKLQLPLRREAQENMVIDRNSIRGLEILETARDGLGKGSLLHAVRRTTTTSGARLLRDRLSKKPIPFRPYTANSYANQLAASPSASLAVIYERLDLVGHFLEDISLREDIISLLRQSYDSQRLVQKFSLGRGDADDLICLARTIEASIKIQSILKARHTNNGNDNREPLTTAVQVKDCLGALLSRLNLDGPSGLAKLILAAIDEEGLMEKQRIEESNAERVISLAQEVVSSESLPDEIETLPKKIRPKQDNKASGAKDTEQEVEDNWIMRRDASANNARLHDKLESLRNEKLTLTNHLREKLGASSLTLRWTPAHGHICHVKGVKDVKLSLDALESARPVSSSKSTRSFYVPAWSSLGARIDHAKQYIRNEEQRIFESLRHQVVLNLVKIRRNAGVLDELDVSCSFATLASEQQLVRPILNNGMSHKIIGGRHPTVKIGLEEQGRSFVSNDCFIGGKERIWLITGPNMAGKSTFLRQNALISILAQVGSFVPAEHAEIGIVDQIFSRIGAADDLFRDQSTFMVEMLETATILKQATPRSFVIMDEVGRGTTPEDGTAVGFACLHHLYHISKCRTLFATHFHALADMTAGFESLGRYCTDVVEDSSGSFSFVHRLKKGVNRQSHALKVARLAGMPDSAVRVAGDTLQQLLAKKSNLRLEPNRV
jgi:DNA mismatch repair ATPase MutS